MYAALAASGIIPLGSGEKQDLGLGLPARMADSVVTTSFQDIGYAVWDWASVDPH